MNHPSLRRLTVPLLVLAGVAVIAAGCRKTVLAPIDAQQPLTFDREATEASSRRTSRTHKITVENLTPAHGGGASQVLSPSLVVVHDDDFELFEVGRRANQAVIDIAEDAIAATGIGKFSRDSDVGFVGFMGGPIPPGETRSFEVTAARKFRHLSLVTMLVSTNDGFTGLDDVGLSGDGRTYWVHAYDAGSEENDQLRASIPGPCCGDTGRNGRDEKRRIRHHRGILAGIGDLGPERWGWPTDRPVAKITVERVR